MGKVHATIKEKDNNTQLGIRSSEITMTILEVSPKATKCGMCQQSMA